MKKDFPIFKQTIHGKPLVFLDNAASTQRPEVVLDALCHFYHMDNANIHRGVYTLSERATNAYEAARETVKTFLNAALASEIVFTRGTTESINLVAQSYAAKQLKPGDNVVVSGMEHHSNLVPWQQVCAQTGAELRIIPVNEAGDLDLATYAALLDNNTKLVALIHASNVLGTVNPVKEMVKTAHEKNIPVVVDGAQAVPHMKVDVQDLDCDFYAFSGHKVYGPTGIGVLYGKKRLLDEMPPYQTGGGMITEVTYQTASYAPVPAKFEAGTPNIAGAIGLAAALDYLHEKDINKIHAHENLLVEKTVQQLNTIPGVKILGHPNERIGVVSFVMENAHPHDIATILDSEGVAVRAGNHCAMPLMQRYKVPATVRVSFGLYNDEADVDQLMVGLHKVQEIFNE